MCPCVDMSNGAPAIQAPAFCLRNLFIYGWPNRDSERKGSFSQHATGNFGENLLTDI